MQSRSGIPDAKAMIESLSPQRLLSLWVGLFSFCICGFLMPSCGCFVDFQKLKVEINYASQIPLNNSLLSPTPLFIYTSTAPGECLSQPSTLKAEWMVELVFISVKDHNWQSVLPYRFLFSDYGSPINPLEYSLIITLPDDCQRRTANINGGRLPCK